MPSGIYERTKFISCSKEKKYKISQTEKGKKIPKEVRQKISKGGKKRWTKKTKEQLRLDMIPLLKGNQKCWDEITDKEKIKRMLPMMEASRALEARQKGSKTRKKWWAKRTKIEKMIHVAPASRASQLANPSSIEKKIWKELDKLGINYKTQVSFGGGWFVVDIYVPIWKLIIECNGDYWHNYEIFPESKIRDKAVEKWAIRNSYKIIWLWEFDIIKNPKQALLKALLIEKIKLN